MITSHFLSFVWIIFILGCNARLKSSFHDKKKIFSTDEYFNEDEFVVEDRRGIGNSHSLYVAQNKESKKYYVFYLDDYRLDSNLNYLILAKLSMSHLDSNQYVQTGTFQNKKGVSKSVIAVEKYNRGVEMPDPSIKIYDLWILNRKKEKFVKKNEKKFHRIHEGYYLKRRVNSWSSYEAHEYLVRNLTLMSSDSLVQMNSANGNNGDSLNLEKVISDFYTSKYVWGLYPEKVIQKLKKLEDMLNEINKRDLKNLDHELWKKIRKESKVILSKIS